METSKNVLRKNLNYLVIIFGLSGCAMMQEPPQPKLVYVETQKKVAIDYATPGQPLATKAEVNKLGYSAASESQVEAFNRTDAQCDMNCSTAITTGGHITYDSRIACHKSCLRANGWVLLNLEGVVQ